MLFHIVLMLDEPERQKQLRRALTTSDTVVEAAKDPRRFGTKLSRKVCDLIVLSRSLMGDNPATHIRKLRQRPDAPAVVVLTEQQDKNEVAQMTAAGCDAVLYAGLSVRKLSDALHAVLDRRRQTTTATLSIPRKAPRAELSDFVARSPAMRRFLKVLPRVARSDASVLILGETGVGKERVAHVLHAESRRSTGPLVAIHCGALPETLLESELFGHEQGAFTGATRPRRGCFELAHQGALFLDEIGEMPLHLQSKLLRVLEDHTVRRVGGETSVSVDVRIMAATNRDLEEAVRIKQFRRDLYFRLNVVSLTIPPLRERIEDIPELVESYLEYLGPRIGCSASRIDDKALTALQRYAWPGNVRELINVIERAMLLCESQTITCRDLPRTITETPSIGTESTPGQSLGAIDSLMDKTLKAARQELLNGFERQYLRQLLEITNGRVGAAAERAGINPRTLFDKLKYYNLDKKEFRSS